MARLYELWQEHEAGLRAQIGDAATDAVLPEAATIAPELEFRRALLLTLRKRDG